MPGKRAASGCSGSMISTRRARFRAPPRRFKGRSRRWASCGIVPFYSRARIASSIERSRGGLGIGLTLVRTLVEMHGGRAEAQSEGHGQGAVFRVYLPLAPSEPAVASELF